MKQGIVLNGVYYDLKSIDRFIDSAQGKEELSFFTEVVFFIKEWFSSKNDIVVYTSGSTGTPKPLRVSKEHMQNSAAMTCSFLQLQKQANALLCMPVKYIAGKMMVVRALVAELSLWVMPPTGRPLSSLSEEVVLDFAAMVPLQVYNSLQEERDTLRLKQIKHLLLGGGAIDEELAATLNGFPNSVYSSYGMTETVSHVAIRHLSGPLASSWYSPLPNVQLSKGEANNLLIHAPHLTSEDLSTNDLVVFNSEGAFQLIGRLDNVINSGGIKIQAEEVELKLKGLMKRPYVITSKKDSKLGEAITLLIEGSPFDTKNLTEAMKQVLTPYELPKHLFFVDQLPLTETKKIKRSRCKVIANRLAESNCPQEG